MATNPSTPSSIFKTRGPLDPVNDSAICASRPELDQILRVVNAPTVDAYLAILSSRQTGKTTLLYQLRQRVRPRGLGVALVDLALVRDQPEDQLYRFVAGEMLSELEPNLPRRTEKRDQANLPSNPIGFRHFLLDTARQLRAARLLVLIDEVEAVSEKYSDAFFGTLRNAFSSRRKEDEIAFEKYLIVFCGARELHRLTGGPNSPLNIADRVYLRDLDAEGVRFIVANFRRVGIAVPEGAAEWLYAQTSGHPYLTQKLCATIEQWHPPGLTPEIVQRAAAEILRSDDHLERLIIQVDAEPPASDLLKQIVSGASVSFSRLKQPVARLELLGAIRDAGQQCVVRNALYLAAFRAHFGIVETSLKQPAPSRRWLRPLLLLLALLVFLVNVPFLYFYTTDILLAAHSVNDRIAPAELGVNAIVHYDQVLRANTPDPVGIKVEIESAVGQPPIVVTFRKSDPDITLKGNPTRQFDAPYHEEDFAFSLYQSGLGALPYNPLQPFTAHRRIDLVFEPQSAGKAPVTYTADFRIDYYSSAVVSVALLVSSVVAFFAGLWVNYRRVRQAIAVFGKFANPPEE
ncbi:MAG: AAA-like domain-containing protein [Chloroflexota bacterium]|nr:AAA-like domain-containing protein [Chloroflexota bacterium]